MSDADRGAYTPPTDAPLSFDARQPVRGARPAPLMLIISILVLVALVATIVAFYRGGARQAGQVPNAVGAPVGEMKKAPTADAQPSDPAAGLQIYKSENGDTAAETPKFTPPPETPQPRPAPSSTVASAGLRPAQPAPAAPAQPTPAPAPKAAPATPAPAETPKAAAPTPAPAATSGGSGAYIVQIGALSSEALADKSYNAAVAIAGGGKGKRIEPVPGKDLYRAQVTGFATRAEAQAYCNKLKAAGGTGSGCFVK